jgi:hypothetical protein
VTPSATAAAATPASDRASRVGSDISKIYPRAERRDLTKS